MEEAEMVNLIWKKHIGAHLRVQVNEQRVSKVLQSLLVGASVIAMPAIKKIPTLVPWGYFAYVGVESLPGNQFWGRILLLFITPWRRYKVLEGDHASFVEMVPFTIVPLAILSAHIHSAAYPPQTVSPRLSSGAGCS
ncbi:HCO3- transporter family [Actinidia rufa]|uniref:HCO3-transporter family n=1 Tax=Actinidia rufa TaxID=165716 RepID=A0A7J0FLR1_9ERIC|nr:HCO3- transporter family [Actinidia rufa]